jgi:hypothetical protein
MPNCYPRLSVLGRTSSTTALLGRRASIAAYAWAVRLADVWVARRRVHCVGLATSFTLSRRLGLLGTCLVWVEGGIRVCSAVVGTGLGVLGRSGLQRVLVLRVFLSEPCGSRGNKSGKSNGGTGEGCALQCAGWLDAEHGEIAGFGDVDVRMSCFDALGARGYSIERPESILRVRLSRYDG